MRAPATQEPGGWWYGAVQKEICYHLQARGAILRGYTGKLTYALETTSAYLMNIATDNLLTAH